jgi:hypothetical protein
VSQSRNIRDQPNYSSQRRLPPTPRQRRIGTQIGIGVVLLALLVIILLDHYGVIH